MNVTIKHVLWAPTVKEALQSIVRQQHLDEKIFVVILAGVNYRGTC